MNENLLSFLGQLPEEELPPEEGRLPFDIMENEPNEDGSIDFQLVDREDEAPKEEDILTQTMMSQDENTFYSNLAESLDSADLDRLGQSLMDAINDDDDSRTEWIKSCEKILKYLGFKIEEELKMPFENAAGVFDTTLSNAVIEFYSNAKMELFPLKGPAISEIIGIPNHQKEDSAQRIELYINTYLTKIDKMYIDESDRLLMHIGLFGCCFRKIYVDPILKIPVARTVTASNLIINNDCSSLLEASRITHVFKLSKKEILMRMAEGFYRDIKLSDIANDEDENAKNQKKMYEKERENEGLRNKKDGSSEEINKTYKVYECYVDLCDGDFKSKSSTDQTNNDIPKPYIISLLENKKILSIRRNFKMGDTRFDRIHCFVKYGYLPSYGLYSYGLGQIIGSNAILMTKVLRQILNSETMKIFPRGIRMKGVEFTKNNYNIGPSEMVEVDTQDRPLNEALQFLELPQQSPMLIDLINNLREQTSKLASAGDVKIPEGGYDAPVGTTLALLEVQNKVTSVIIQSLHRSLSEELEMIFKLFQEGMTSPYGFNVQGMYVEVHPEDFQEDINIVPTSNPQVSTIAHSLIKAESLLKMAQSAPEIHDLRAAFANMYKIMKIDNIDEILPPPPPPNPNAPPPIDPQETLRMDVEVKAQSNQMKNEQEMLKNQISFMKTQIDYLVQWQKIILSYQQAGLNPPMLPDIPIPDPLLQGGSPTTHMDPNMLRQMEIQKQVQAQQMQAQQQPPHGHQGHGAGDMQDQQQPDQGQDQQEPDQNQMDQSQQGQ
jgi:hypothetical protein